MPMKQTGRKVYRTLQGKVVDMDLLRQRNELTPAVGNAKVNARGDELGPGGRIVRKREEVMREYYQNNPNVPDEIAVKKPAKDLEDDWVEPEPEPVKKTTSKTTSTKTTATSESEWIEDAEGNFIPKGE